MITDHNVTVDINSSQTTMCIKSSSGVSYIELISGGGSNMTILPSPIDINAYRGGVNGAISKEPN